MSNELEMVSMMQKVFNQLKRMKERGKVSVSTVAVLWISCNLCHDHM